MTSLSEALLLATLGITGFLLMAMEVVGLREMAPYFGTSTLVSSGTIGVILAGLSVGYLGGAFKSRISEGVLALLLAGSGLWIVSVAAVGTACLHFFARFGIETGSILSALILFFVPSLLLAAFSPLVVQRLSRNRSAGMASGLSSSVSALGSVLGIFVTGYVLLPTFGIRAILFSSSAVLLLLAGLLIRTKTAKILLFLAALVALGLLGHGEDARFLAEGDTLYNHYRIFDRVTPKGERVRNLYLGSLLHSSVILGQTSDRALYLHEFERDREIVPSVRKALLLGGGAMTFPRAFVERHPQASIVAVEIDPDLEALSRKYFEFRDDPRISLIHEDARLFINSGGETYDVIFCDAFSAGASVPFQLVTDEALKNIRRLLNPTGAYFLNLVAGTTGPGAVLLEMEVNTMRRHFSNVVAFPSMEGTDARRNIVLVATNASLPASWLSYQVSFKAAEGNARPYFTDDFSPVEYLVDRF